MPEPKKCSYCDGTGKFKLPGMLPERCKWCAGTGKA
jgi:DnaJ-class molecular chaperone